MRVANTCGRLYRRASVLLGILVANHHSLHVTATTSTAWKRDKLGHCAPVQIRRYIDRALYGLDPINQMIVITRLDQKLITCDFDADHMWPLRIIGCEPALSALHRISVGMVIFQCTLDIIQLFFYIFRSRLRGITGCMCQRAAELNATQNKVLQRQWIRVRLFVML